jgi:hypothetical protein
MTYIKIGASIMGVSIDDEKEEKVVKEEKSPFGVPFGDPSSYKNMSKEKREKLTEEMISGHRNWARGKSNIKDD